MGQTTCTGIHGANRLPNSSLTETVYWALKAAKHASEHCCIPPVKEKVGLGVPEWQARDAVQSKDEVQVAYHWDEVRRYVSMSEKSARSNGIAVESGRMARKGGQMVSIRVLEHP